MRSVRRKWHSAAGTTFAFALGVFLICSMFAMAILSTNGTLAVSSMGQLSSEQEFLSVSCAAKLLTEAVENSRIYEIQHYSGGAASNKTYAVSGGEYEIVENVIKEKVRQSASEGKLNITAPNMSDVKVSIKFDRIGTRVQTNFTATLKTTDQTVQLYFVGREEPNVERTYDAGDVLESTSTELRWSLQSVTKG